MIIKQNPVVKIDPIDWCHSCGEPPHCGKRRGRCYDCECEQCQEMKRQEQNLFKSM